MHNSAIKPWPISPLAPVIRMTFSGFMGLHSEKSGCARHAVPGAGLRVHYARTPVGGQAQAGPSAEGVSAGVGPGPGWPPKACADRGAAGQIPLTPGWVDVE